MKKILALILCILFVLPLVSCGEEETETVEIINVTGNTYKVDLATINIAWDEGKEPTKYEKETFIASIKSWFGNSKIIFSSENSFSLSGTNNQTHDFYAESCERVDNELFKELKMRGNVDVLILDGKVSFLCDFFVKGWGMYVSIDYMLEK